MMKKHFIVIIILVLFSLKNNAQENKLNLSAVSLAYGGFQPQKTSNLSSSANLYIGLDVIMTVNKHRLFFSLNRGHDLEVLGSYGKRYNLEVDVLYGKNIKLYNWLFLEVAIGIGYFQGSYYKSDDITETWEDSWGFIKYQDNSKNNVRLGSVSLPLKSKLLFYTSSRFSLGANINVSINKISNLTAYCFVAQWNFK